MKKKLAIAFALVVLSATVPVLYARATYNRNVEVLYKRKLKMRMGDPAKESLPDIKKVAECQIEQRMYKRFNQDFFRDFIILLKKSQGNVISKNDIQRLGDLVEAFEGAKTYLTVAQKRELIATIRPLSTTNDPDTAQLILLLISQIETKECIPLLKNLQMSVDATLKTTISGHLVEAEHWEEKH